MPPTRVKDLLPPAAICLELKNRTRAEVLKELVELLAQSHQIKHSDHILQSLTEREEIGPTCIGPGIAVPHAKSNAIEHPVGVLGISKSGVDFGCPDGKPVHILFLLITPNKPSEIHLRMLAKVSYLLKDDSTFQSLLKCKSASEVLDCIP